VNRNKILFITCFLFLLTTGCGEAGGTYHLRGKVIDEKTRTLLPGRKIIVQGLAGVNNKTIPFDIGMYSTDNAGYFTSTLKKYKDVYRYNFIFPGDSAYAFTTHVLGITELKRNGLFLSFSLPRLADLTITIQRISKTPAQDFLYVSWQTDGKDGKSLYPYKIENYGTPPDIGLRWTGKNVKSVIRTKALAGKKTIVYFDLIRNGTKKEITDTIFCNRDSQNYVNFKY
jgi:hypothetical protein